MYEWMAQLRLRAMKIIIINSGIFEEIAVFEVFDVFEIGGAFAGPGVPDVFEVLRVLVLC